MTKSSSFIRAIPRAGESDYFHSRFAVRFRREMPDDVREFPAILVDADAEMRKTLRDRDRRTNEAPSSRFARFHREKRKMDDIADWRQRKERDSVTLLNFIDYPKRCIK